MDIICIQEQRYKHCKLKQKYHDTDNGWTFMFPSTLENTIISTAIGGVEILLSLCALKSLNSIERIQLRMICATFNGNPCTTVISCYTSTNGSNEVYINTFNHMLSSLVWHIPKDNILIMEGEMNRQTHETNGEYLAEYSLLNRFAYPNMKL